MALRIERAFGMSMDMLPRMQAWHDASRMHARASEVSVDPYRPGWLTAGAHRPVPSVNKFRNM